MTDQRLRTGNAATIAKDDPPAGFPAAAVIGADDLGICGGADQQRSRDKNELHNQLLQSKWLCHRLNLEKKLLVKEYPKRVINGRLQSAPPNEVVEARRMGAIDK